MPFKIGVCGGNFDPPHMGHIQVLLQAASQCELLYIILNCARDFCSVPVEYRHRWLIQMTRHIGNTKVLLLEDNIPNVNTYENDDCLQKYADKIHSLIGNPIDAVFCCSDCYENNDCATLYPESKFIPNSYSNSFVSSSQIRTNPFMHWDNIPNIVKPYYVKRILLVGSESTGKSTLTKSLALAYNTNYIEESGREICEKAACEDAMLPEDLHKCLLYQKTAELDAIQFSNKLLFIDTDALITKFFIRFFLPDSNEKTKCEKLADAITEINKFDLVFFLEPTVAFVKDGTRHSCIEQDRERYSSQIKELFDQAGIPFTSIGGNYLERFNQATAIINKLFGL